MSIRGGIILIHALRLNWRPSVYLLIDSDIYASLVSITFNSAYFFFAVVQKEKASLGSEEELNKKAQESR